MRSIESVIDYQFENKLLLERALSHASYVRQQSRKEYKDNYQRLEFLGDSVLQLIITDYLLTKFPHQREGVLAKMRSSLVCGESLSQAALTINLGEYILLSRNEENNGGRNNPSTLEDITEALIGAIYLDGGFRKAKKFVLELLKTQLKNINVGINDPKSYVQEWTQAKRKPMPEYQILDVQGEEHDPTFIVSLTVDGTGSSEGKGNTKKRAERDAARNFISKYKVEK